MSVDLELVAVADAGQTVFLRASRPLTDDEYRRLIDSIHGSGVYVAVLPDYLTVAHVESAP